MPESTCRKPLPPVKWHLPCPSSCFAPHAATAYLGATALAPPVWQAGTPALDGWVGSQWAQGAAFGKVPSCSNSKVKRISLWYSLLLEYRRVPSMQDPEVKRPSQASQLKQKNRRWHKDINGSEQGNRGKVGGQGVAPLTKAPAFPSRPSTLPSLQRQEAAVWLISCTGCCVSMPCIPLASRPMPNRSLVSITCYGGIVAKGNFMERFGEL